jgi:heterotetrameric sarcosine oxidase alpha subunit
MNGPARISGGLLTDSGRPLRFSFDGRPLRGLHGDTLASALLANGERLFGRSFKYHRRRGVLTCGSGEPCALVDVIGSHGREPNQPATLLPLREGLSVESQNRWPSLRFDVLGINDLLSRFLPAGFYYKTFMYPGWAWERIYEPLIRRAAGLGRLQAPILEQAAPAETVHAHTQVLIVGAGPAGLSAAHALGSAGLSVMLIEQDVLPGGGTLLDERWTSWRAEQLAALARLPQVRCLTDTAIVGAYGHGVFGALETLGPDEAQQAGGLRERLYVLRAQRVLIATGAAERLIAFPGNDTPGVMLAGAALAYLRRYGVAVGARAALFANNDEAYDAVFALAAAGLRCAGVIDVRSESPAAERARALGIEVHTHAVVRAVAGRGAIESLTVTDADGSHPRTLQTDCLLMSGGYSPLTALATQMGAAAQWREELAAFTARLPPHAGALAGAAHGVFGLAAAARDGLAAAGILAREFGVALPAPAGTPLPEDAARAPLLALWEVAAPGKAFVDLQNDVTAADVRLAYREGYEDVEHMKRYTTHGMATDQGRSGGLVGSAVLAAARGVTLAQVGLPRPRPYSEPVPFAALAGGEVREHYKPKRRLPLHAWHEAAGASFVSTGLWLRPLVYGGGGWEPVLAEARNVRSQVGITDVSTLGKIDVQGADAAQFLDFIYANTFSTLPVARARYGIMLREDGMMFDDGTTTRLAPTHFLITTTTANSAAVFEHLEFQLQANCPQLQALITDVTDQWAQFAIAGPRARAVLAAALPATDLSNEALPFMAATAVTLEEIPARLFRISFSGELAYELAVPARYAQLAWQALLAAGEAHGIRPYGLDALNTLRIEKGHVTAAELNGNTSADDLGFQRMLKKQGDFIGRVLAQRSGMLSGERLQLVGVRPSDSARRLRNGMQLVQADAPQASLGYITSSTPAVELPGWVGLALLAGGRRRVGTRLLASSPVHGESVPVEIVSPHMLDPENTRVRA